MIRARLLPLFLLLACAQGGEAPPEGVLDRERFKEILLEAHLIEARVNHELSVQRLPEVYAERYYEDLFAEYGTTRAAFDSSYMYYASRPEELKAIHEEIITELTQRKDRPVSQER